VKHLRGKYAIDVDGVITERGSVRAI
jgi:hypothetical protein